MRIGVDATCWGNRRGFGRFTRELMSALLEIDKTNEYLLFVDRDISETNTLPSGITRVTVNTRHSPTRAASADSSRSLIDLWAMTRAVWRHKIDVFFFPAVYSYFPVLNRTELVVTLHDIIADHHPDLIFPNLKSKLFWKLKQYVAVRQSALIATVSEHSKKQIAEYFDLAESKIRVISEGARPVFRVLEETGETIETLARHRLEPGDKFLLYVGGISPHKNLAALINAFEKISTARRDVKMVLVGDYKDDPFFSAYPSLKRQVGELGLEDKVIFTGFIPDEDLVHLYNTAQLLVFPSLEEGFGLPAIEAMSCGTPVLASNCGSLPEVLGEAGSFFNPRDPADMANVITHFLDDDEMRKTMRENGLKRAQKFTWNTGARETLAIFDELAVRK